MELVPIRCHIPEHLKRLGKTQQWLADQTGMSKQQINDYIHLRYVLGFAKAREVALILKVPTDDLYEWEWRGE